MPTAARPNSAPEGGGAGELPRSEQFARHARKSADPQRRAELLLQAAHLCEEVEKDEKRAIGLYREALEAEPHQHAALIALERIYLRASNWRALYEIYGLHADALLAEDKSAARTQIYSKMARLALERLGEPELAAVCYENLLEASPGEPEAIRFLLGRYEESQDWQGARTLLEAQVPRVADSIERAELLRILGDTLRFAAEHLEQAAVAYQEAWRADPLNRGAFKGLIETLEDLGREGELMTLFFERARTLEEDLPNPTAEEELFEVRLQLADLLAEGEGEQRAQARRVLEAAAALKPRDPRILRREGEWAIGEGAFERGAQAYETLLQVAGNGFAERPAVLLELAALYRHHLNDPDKAQDFLNRALHLLRGDPLSEQLAEAQRMLGELAWERGDTDTARQVYGGLLEKAAPEDKNARCEYNLRLAELAVASGEPEQALEHYEQVIAVFPRFRRALHERAELLYAMERWQDALAAYFTYLDVLESAEKESEAGGRAILRLATVYARLDDTDRAEQRYVTLLRHGREEPAAHQGLARIYERAGRNEEAEDHWAWLREHYARLQFWEPWAEASEQLARLLEFRGESVQAGALYEELLIHSPGRTFARERLAIICESQNRWSAARDHYQKLLADEDALDPERRRQLAAALEKAERNAFYEEDLS